MAVDGNKPWAYVCSKGLFSEGLIIGGNFVFQNRLGLTIKTAKNTKETALLNS